MTVILDAGALLAIDRRDRTILKVLRLAEFQGVSIRTSGAVVAQVWRDGARQANLARSLPGIDVAPLDRDSGKAVGRLLARSGTADVVDGHVATLTRAGDDVLTSDPDDIRRLLDVDRIQARVIRI